MDQKVALITGSSHGIGAGIAKILGSRGYTIIVTYVTDAPAADSVVAEVKKNGAVAMALRLEVTSEESVKKAFEAIEKQFGKLNVLVNNAGVDFGTSFEAITFNEWKAVTRTKVDGNFLCTKYALPLLKKSDNANVVVIMSILGEKADAEDPAYCVGTAGTVMFVKTMALALAKYKIRVNGVGPSEVKTNSNYWQQYGNDRMWQKLAKENPQGRMTTPEDVGEAVRTIIEDPTDRLTGNFIYVTGGSHLK